MSPYDIDWNARLHVDDMSRRAIVHKRQLSLLTKRCTPPPRAPKPTDQPKVTGWRRPPVIRPKRRLQIADLKYKYRLIQNKHRCAK